MANALMMIPNLSALLLLWKVIVAETDDHFTNLLRKKKYKSETGSHSIL
ncbi:sodium/glycine symporter GlyP [Bacillus sp. JCM 19046]|nr:sodium/glycine symporter GlyP [Bacillus sp. JCM 19046]